MKILLTFALGLGLGSGFVACTKTATSNQPNYVFKSAPTDGLVAKIAGKEITEQEAYKGVENDIFEAENKVYEIKMNRLRALVVEVLMEQDPRKEGMSNDEFLNTHVAKDIQVTQKEIDAFAAERQIPAENMNDQMKARIKEYIEMELKHKAVDKWIADKTAKNPVEIYLKKPNRPVFEVEVGNAPFMGDKDAKVTIVEFSDFQCPFCARGAAVTNEIKKKYGDKVKIAFKNFPLPFHNHARAAAMAGLCVHEQNPKAFWKMHDLMFEDQQGLDQEGLKSKARQVGAKIEQFEECMTTEKFADQINSEVEQGTSVGVKSTPTFFVNGMVITGAQAIEVFSELIDQELGK